MAGKKESAEKLNKTLLFLITLLNDNNIKKWFICYGTLLGLVRENSCIDQDDDIDLIIDKNYYDTVKKILIDNKFILNHRLKTSKNIIKTNNTADYASIDIYMGKFDDKHVLDLHNKLTITNCYLDIQNKTFVEKEWNEQKIYFPNDYERILITRDGKDWNIKKNKKIPEPKSKIL